MKAQSASRRIQRVQSPVIPTVGQWVAEHPGTISLGQGVVHYGPPCEVRAAVTQALEGSASLDRYGAVRGTEDLLQQVADKVSRENGIDLEGCRVICTAGSNMGFLNAVLAIADIDDEIILLSPYYFNQHMAVELAGCRVVEVPTDNQYQPVLNSIAAAITPRTRAVVTISPNNPTGAVYSRETLVAINRLCSQRGCYHISDEAYEYFTYGTTQHFSPASCPSSRAHTISLFSLSKAYGMAGWRCGYMIVPQELELAVKKIQDTNLICPPLVGQVAAKAALEVGRDWCHSAIQSIITARAGVQQELDRLGASVRVSQSEGAFYFLLKLDTDQSALNLVHRLISDFGVAVLPGDTFGVTSHCSIRLSYGSLAADTVAEGIGRLKRGLQHLL